MCSVMAVLQEKGQRPGHGSGALGLPSGPATHQPSGLGQHCPTFFYLLILTWTIETRIPTFQPSSDYRENPVM